MHHGVAILSRLPIVEDDRLDWQANGEARHIGVRLPNGMRIENVYVPAGGDIPDRTLNPKFGQKLDFVERMTRWSETLRSEEHTSELQSLMRISYAVFCLLKKKEKRDRSTRFNTARHIESHSTN